MSDEVVRVRYKLRSGIFLLSVVGFFGVCAIVLASAAQKSRERDSTHLWILSATTAGIAGIGGFAMLKEPGEIVIGDGALVAPKSAIRSKRVTIRLSDIVGISIGDLAMQRFLQVNYPDGELVIVESALPNGMDVEDVILEIQNAQRNGKDIIS
ncbi:hypothetical protein N9L47_08840 [Rhodobacteraceae bacterium]|nr:hypothetical protein [Paracoccaceae bacterium]